MKKKSFYNVAVVGAGAIGQYHIKSFRKHPAARIVALAETSPERGREVAGRFGIPDLDTDYRDVLRRAEIDIVSIALPNYLHAPVALAALQAGKHVMLDKPMATNARDAAKLVAEAKRHRRLLMIGQNQRFAPTVQTLKQLVDRGALGEVYHAKAAWLRRSGIPRIGSWFTQKQFAGGGCTYDIGVHVLDQTLYLMGEFEAAAVSAQTYAKFGPRGQGDGSWGKSEIDPRKPFDVDDFSVALIKLRSGRTVLLEASWAAHQRVQSSNGTQLFGTAAGATTHPPRLFRPGRKKYTVEPLPSLPPLVSPDRMVHFINVLLGREQPFVRPEESLAVQKILDAIYLSAATGREVRLR
ncbi:MAG: Gfo/Idh/MocA family oxidoreductase [Opitutaceae bacterium]|nr:Gfo/Idh/MocA family oxidoreductase [Opitutaceae bacterium]